MSPRETSISSVERQRDRLAGDAPRRDRRPWVTMRATLRRLAGLRRRRPRRPAATAPEATVPAKPRKSRFGPVDPLHREAERPAGGARPRRRPSRDARAASGRRYQGMSALGVDDVVAVARRHRDRRRSSRSRAARRSRRSRPRSSSKRASVEVDQVHLVDRQHDVADAEQRGDEGVAARLGEHALARIDQQRSARSAVEAPVAMLRVYCSWPGVSATMNLRCRRREVAVGDVDGDALLALGLAGRRPAARSRCRRRSCRACANRVSSAASWSSKISLRVVEQPADQRRLAVVDAAAGQEAQQRLAARAPARIGARRRRAASALRRARPSEIALALLLLHRAGLVVVDQRGPAAPRCAAISISATISVERRRRRTRSRRSADSSRACGSGPSRFAALSPGSSGMRSSSTMISMPSRSTTGRSAAK